MLDPFNSSICKCNYACIIDEKMCCTLFACYLLLCWKEADSRNGHTVQTAFERTAILLPVSIFVSNFLKLQQTSTVS